MTFWQALPDGVTVAVKVQPKARRPGLHGISPGTNGQRLRISVTEPAEDGRANRAACAALAEALGVARSAVRVVLGATNREKRLHIAGDPAVLGARLTAL